MRIHAYASALAAFCAPAVAQTDAQADVTGATPILVAPNSLSIGQLESIKRSLGVQSASKINSTGSEVWQVPNAKLGQAFATAAHNPKLAVDYRGDDYRTLFLPVASADLGPGTSATLEQIRQDPTLSDVQLVRLRSDGISKQILRSGFGTADGLPAAGSVLLNVRPGLDVVMQRKSLQESGGQLKWSGTAAAFDAPAAAAAPSGDATLVARGDKILGSIQVGTDSYSVIPLDNGLHAIAKINQAAFPPEHPPQTPALPNGDAPLADAPAMPHVAGPAEVMIGVAYTQAAADAIQDYYHVPPEQLAATVIEITNVGYRESLVTSHLKLAGTKLITGAELPDFDSMVAAVVNPKDGKFDAVHQWRQSVKADAVLVLVSLNAYCGMAADIYTPAPKAFAIVNWKCAKDNLSFPHEFGHLLGARHDPDTDPESRPFSYAHGYRVQTWRTIMSYDGGVCAGCPRINRWANPNQQFNGVPMGTADKSYDARLIEEMLPVFGTYLP